MPRSQLILPTQMSMRTALISLPRDTIAIERTKFLWQAVCYERIGFRNYADSTGISASRLGLAPIFMTCSRFAERRANGAALVRQWSLRKALGFITRGSTILKRKTELRFWPLAFSS